jgi:membrane fusion protein (multidrug efflux system)
MSTTPENIPQAGAPANPPNGQRRRRLLILATVFAVIGAGFTGYQLLFGRYHVDTDNAYVNGNLVQITPQTAGTVIGIGADDTDLVDAGRTLVELDPADARVALDQAESRLASSVREVRATLATTDSLRAQLTSRESDLNRARADHKRRYDMRASGAVSREDLAHAEAALRSAEAQAESARQQLAANLAQTEHTTVETHPLVASAAAGVREAYLGYARTKLPAPVSGFVAKRSVQVGQRVQPGAPLMAIVPLDGLWVDANFKEAQLRKLRIGQPVTLHADIYGDAVEYHGRVEGFAAGTGSAFSLLPAQNATGNWIKVVQRLAVRIALEPEELKAHPLRVGLSMHVDVDAHDLEGSQLAQAAHPGMAYETAVFTGLAREADHRVAEIIAANSAAATATASVQHAAP